MKNRYIVCHLITDLIRKCKFIEKEMIESVYFGDLDSIEECIGVYPVFTNKRKALKCAREIGGSVITAKLKNDRN